MDDSKRSSRAGTVEEVVAAFEAFQQRLMAVHAAEFTTLEITMSQAKLLYLVAAVGQLTMSDIAHRLGISVSTASGAVDHLVALGLLSRADDPANRRQVHVSITADGRERLEHLRELSSRQMRMLLEVLSDDDLAAVDRSIRALIDAVPRVLAAATPTAQPLTPSSAPASRGSNA